MKENNKRFIITKKIAKHGSQAIIVIPRILEERLKPGTLAEITIDIIDEDKKE
jgi:hypothetical protein